MEPTTSPELDRERAEGNQKKWLRRLSDEQTSHKKFRDRSTEVERVYRAELEDKPYVPLYWQVCAVEHTGVYSNQPVPDVRPRNEERDPLKRS